ncbi:hypothetical protein ACH5RR_008360 [Cinchona calisaya]|uniref:Uncharacterized protein n=1 Tax=Cinchona calisaya TaxID=153742 RepID=A0ABD3AH34_9GENT
MNELHEIKAILAVLREHMQTVDAALDSLRLDLVVTKQAVTSGPLDDFDLILRKEFMVMNRIFPIPHLDGVMIADERCPSFIRSIFVKIDVSVGPSSSGDKGKQGSQISTIQLENGLTEIKADVFQEFPYCCVAGLDEFADIMPARLPKMLPPQRAENHHIGPVPEKYPRLKLPVAWS